MRIRSLALVLAAALGAAPFGAAAGPVTTNDVMAETARTFREDSHIVNFWWLPVEYWVAAARELGKTDGEVAAIRALYSNYLIVAVLDIRVTPDGSVKPLSTAEIVRRLDVEVNERPAEVMSQVDAKLQEMAPDLSYILRASLGQLGIGLRLLPFPNLDAESRIVFRSDRPGTIRIRYRASTTDEPAEFWWHAPVTAVVGGKRCPGSGAPMEASWLYCPWDGKRVE